MGMGSTRAVACARAQNARATREGSCSIQRLGERGDERGTRGVGVAHVVAHDAAHEVARAHGVVGAASGAH